MTRRHQIASKLEAFGDVRAILAAMKNIALAELRKLAGLLEHQRRAMDTIERAAADFVAFHPPAQAAGEGARLCVVIGSERGFCGEFNKALAEAARARLAAGERLLLVGTKLAERCGANCDALAGASVAEELPATLERVAAWLVRAQSAARGAPSRVEALYQDPESAQLLARVLMPLPTPARPRRPQACAPQLTLAPGLFFAALAEQALLMALHEAFSVSLIAENRWRFEHMEGALRRLDEITGTLARRANAYRQEEITQEIEVIMLSAEALDAREG